MGILRNFAEKVVDAIAGTTVILQLFQTPNPEEITQDTTVNEPTAITATTMAETQEQSEGPQIIKKSIKEGGIDPDALVNAAASFATNTSAPPSENPTKNSETKRTPRRGRRESEGLGDNSSTTSFTDKVTSSASQAQNFSNEV